MIKNENLFKNHRVYPIDFFHFFHNSNGQGTISGEEKSCEKSFLKMSIFTILQTILTLFLDVDFLKMNYIISMGILREKLTKIFVFVVFVIEIPIGTWNEIRQIIVQNPHSTDYFRKNKNV